MPKVLIVTGDAGESLEVMYPYQRLLEEGYEVDIAAPSRKRLQFVMCEFVDGLDTYTEKPGYSWPADLAFDEVDPAGYVALVIPGGRAPEYIRAYPDFQRIVTHFFEEDKPVAQHCHAPVALGTMGLLQGRRTAAYPLLAPDVELAGAEYVDDEAVVDGRMVSARSWPDNPAWMREFVRVLRERAPSDGGTPDAKGGRSPSAEARPAVKVPV